MSKKLSLQRLLPLFIMLALLWAGASGKVGAAPALDTNAPKAAESIFAVNDAGDQPDATPGDNVCQTNGGVCTLRAALQEANATAVTDFIIFALPGNAPYVIKPQTAYPDISHPLRIKGSTQTAANGTPQVVIDGSLLNNGTALRFLNTAPDSVINGLEIKNFSFAVWLSGNNSVIGSDLDGANDLKERCVLVNNGTAVLLGNTVAAPVTGVQVNNNWIGTLDGVVGAPNTGTGVLLDSARSTSIGQNLISGQINGYGVYIATGSDHNWLWGNMIGTNAAATAALPNKYGVYIHDNSATNQADDLNRVGVDPAMPQSAIQQRNIISGNTEYNVGIEGVGAMGNIIRGNWLGPLNLSAKYLPSKRDIYLLDRVSRTQIMDNVIGGTGLTTPSAGIELASYVNNTTIQGNLIGVMPDALTAAPGKYGIYLNVGSYRTLIGTDGDGNNDVFEGNTISGADLGGLASEGYGVYAVGNGTSQNVIAGNRIGTKAGDNWALPNKWGVYIDAGALDNRIGSDMNGVGDADEANIIAYNSKGGVAVSQVFRNSVRGNSIYSNVGLGIDLNGDGPTTNDPADADNIGNRGQNYPVISSATLAGNALNVSFMVDTATSNADYALNIDFYKADAAGQGRAWIGRIGYTAGESQTSVNRSFTPGGAVTISPGDQIVATATDQFGNTSEFSRPATTVSGPTTTPTTEPTPTPCAISFSDVHSGDYFYEPVRYLFCTGVISGYQDNTFRPGNNTTRGQLSKIVVGAAGWPINTNGGPHFNDVAPASAFYSFIETAFNHGVISGYQDGTFRPGANVSRGQLSKIVVLAKNWPLIDPATPTFQDVAKGSTFYQVIETAYSKSIISGYDLPGGGREFRPGNSATRGQISKIVYLAMPPILSQQK